MEQLPTRLKDAARVLEETGAALARARSEGGDVPPAGTWLLENSCLLQDHLRIARRALADKHLKQLPQAAEAGAGCPRICRWTQQFIVRVDGEVDEPALHQFLGDSQRASRLTLAELWAIPTMLRLGLLERLRDVAVHLPQSIRPPDFRAQAADEVSAGNAISSLRGLRNIDWKTLVERQSAVEQVLRQDPAGIYGRMDFEGRDGYRRVVERLARRTGRTEEEVARIAIERARQTQTAQTSEVSKASEVRDRQHHVGYYLVGPERPLLEEAIGYRPDWRERMARATGRAPLAWYLGAGALVWLLCIAGVAVAARRLNVPQTIGPLASLLVLVSFAGAAGQFALSVVNWLCTLIVSPRAIVRLDFSGGIPQEHRALVAIPTIVANEETARTLIEQLEVRYLANPDDNLLFALLTDYSDAPRETLPGDQGLLDQIRSGIAGLNARYCAGRPTTFYLLHRARQWNPKESLWMGKERKRGKLEALNTLLRTGSAEAFAATEGELGRLSSVRYVITLDTDTALPPGAGRELVGCMAHPMNRPRLDPKTRTVTEGYGILQPRVATTIPHANRSFYSRLAAVDAGIDPYTRQTSDAYQDLFAEGSYIGKGIYDVDALRAALEGRFPENRVLSHDLIEGCFARSGLASDVVLFEAHPSRLLADMSRRHRWIRGDWQIAAWLFPRVPAANGRAKNPLSWLSRWKIFDNLRRSLMPVFLLAYLIVGWTLAPQAAWFWTLTALGIVFAPTWLACAVCALRKPEENLWRIHLKNKALDCLKSTAREAIGLYILPYTAHCHLDAIVRALWRLGVSRKRLLEWTTASDAETLSEGSRRYYYEIMGACTAVGLAVAAAVTIAGPEGLLFAGPVLASWLAGPMIAWWLSQARDGKPLPLREEEARHVRRWARQTWHYFDTHVREEHHWLPPDNVRDRAGWIAAPFASPTNIGMGLLAELAACDLGYLSPSAFLGRIGRTLGTLGRMDRYRGHFFNWYNTRTLAACEPRYVSTVDSGNLWGSLKVLRVGLEEMRDRPVVPPRLVEGIQDTLEVIGSLGRSVAVSSRLAEFEGLLTETRAACDSPLGRGAAAACAWLLRVRERAEALRAKTPADSPELVQWTEALVHQCAAAHEDISRLAFWIAVVGRVSNPRADGSGEPSHVIHFGADDFQNWIERLDRQATLRDLAEAEAVVARYAASLSERWPHGEAREQPRGPNGTVGWIANPSYRHPVLLEPLSGLLRSLEARAKSAAAAARQELQTIAALAGLCEQSSAMDLRFLFDSKRKALAIGYRLEGHRADASAYDLLASESRLASFLAISHGQIPHHHWQELGRNVALAHGRPVLLSWSGSMFEYLMPMLLMPTYPGTLLHAACRDAVRRQIRYARRRGVPWGISESCCNETDGNLGYRYRAFGVPGLGLRLGLRDELVIAPYASALAAMVAPREAVANLRRLEAMGCLSPYGFLDAVDHTPGRCLADGRPAPCRAVMAHHSGMTVLALANVLLGGSMQRRFGKDPLCQAHDLLLQERAPQDIRPVDPEKLDAGSPSPQGGRAGDYIVRVPLSSHAAAPEAHVLGNGAYSAILVSSGGSVVRFRAAATTASDADPAHDDVRQFCYLRDAATGRFWSATHPSRRGGTFKYQVVFSPGMAEYRLEREQIEAQTRISVSPEHNVEVRELTLTNLSPADRTIELASYAEALLPPGERDGAPPVPADPAAETDSLPRAQAVLCTRRAGPRNGSGRSIFHIITLRDDGQRYDGERPGRLSGVSGSVVGSVLSVRQSLVLAGESSAVAQIVTGFADSREEAIALAEQYREPRLASRAFKLATAAERLALQHLRVGEEEVRIGARLAAALFYSPLRTRAESKTMDGRQSSRAMLWSFGIRGGRPVVLLRCKNPGRLGAIERLLGARRYWRVQGFEIDVVLWVESRADDGHALYDRAAAIVGSDAAADLADRSAGIYLLRSDHYGAEQFHALQAAAHVCLDDDGVPLADQIQGPRLPRRPFPALRATDGWEVEAAAVRDAFRGVPGPMAGAPRGVRRPLRNATKGAGYRDAGKKA